MREDYEEADEQLIKLVGFMDTLCGLPCVCCTSDCKLRNHSIQRQCSLTSLCKADYGFCYAVTVLLIMGTYLDVWLKQGRLGLLMFCIAGVLCMLGL